MSPAELLSLIAERAAELRKAGVRVLELPELKLELLPYEGEPVASASGPDRGVTEMTLVDEPDPFDDAVTFGRRDGKVPGYKAQINEQLGDDFTGTRR